MTRSARVFRARKKPLTRNFIGSHSNGFLGKLTSNFGFKRLANAMLIYEFVIYFTPSPGEHQVCVPHFPDRGGASGCSGSSCVTGEFRPRCRGEWSPDCSRDRWRSADPATMPTAVWWRVRCWPAAQTHKKQRGLSRLNAIAICGARSPQSGGGRREGGWGRGGGGGIAGRGMLARGNFKIWVP